MASKLTAGDLQVVTRIAVFRGLRTETIEHIIAPATVTMLRPHMWLTRQDDPATAFFIMIDGWLKLYRSAASGDDTTFSKKAIATPNLPRSPVTVIWPLPRR